MRKANWWAPARTAALALAAAGAAGAQTAPAYQSIMLTQNCMSTYAVQGTAGSLAGTCVGAVPPLGGATAVLTLRGTYNEKDEISGVSGTLKVTLINNDTFEAALTISGIVQNPNGSVNMQANGNISQGSGRLNGAIGSLDLSMQGVPVKEGTATVSIGGQGRIAAPGFTPGPPAPMGPGVLGNPAVAQGASCGQPVTVSNGNMFHQFMDLGLNTRGLPIVFLRTYNSQAAAVDGPLGYGWAHSYQRYLVDRGTSVVYVGESGGALTFLAQGGGYAPAAAGGMSLSKDGSGWLLKTRAGVTARFGQTGKMEWQEDRNGNRQTFGYDGQGRLNTMAGGDGEQAVLRYDAAGRIIDVQDHTGRRTSYQYDGTGNLTSSVDPAGNRTTYAYYAGVGTSHHLKQITVAGGGSISFEYGADNRLARSVDLAGGETKYSYASGQTAVTDWRGAVTTFVFNDRGNVTRIVRSDGTSVEQVWDASGRLTARRDELGNVTRFVNDEAGRVVSQTDAMGGVISYEYDKVTGRLASFTDAAGVVTRYEYDDRGNRVKIVDPLGGETRMTYNSDGSLLSTANAAGRIANYGWDAQGSPREASDGGGKLAEGRFDNLRRLTGTTDVAGRESSFEYDELDRLVKSAEAMQGTVQVTYDAVGNVTGMKGAGVVVAGLKYDTAQNLVEMTDMLGGVARFGYDASGLPLTMQDARGKTARLEYDSLGRVATATDALGNKRRYVWDSRGDVASYTDENGNKTLYEYDALRRLVREVLPDGSEQIFTWDTRGNMLPGSNAEVTFSFTYDAAGRTTSVTDSRGPFTLTYTHEPMGRRASMQDPWGGVTSYEYGESGLLARIVAPGERVFQFAYNGDRSRRSLTYPNGLAAEPFYDGAGRMNRMSFAQPGSAPVEAYDLFPDENGDIAAVSDLNGLHQFEYDKLRRLTGAAHPVAPPEKYAYDAAGNRAGTGISHDDAGRLTESGGMKYKYDANGNVVERSGGSGVTVFRYDYRNRLVAAVLPDGSQAAYKYDPFGRRIEKRASGKVIRYVYDADRLLAEVDEAGQVIARYMWRPGSQEALGMERGGAHYIYVTDFQGNVSALVDEAGAVAQRYTYGVFGQNVGAEGAVANPLRFVAREYDEETGLYRIGLRYYDPLTGRFLQKEPMSADSLLALRARGEMAAAVGMGKLAGLMRKPGGLNAYAYASNNPVNRADVTGLDEASLTSLLAGGQAPKVEAVMHLLAALTKPQKPSALGAAPAGWLSGGAPSTNLPAASGMLNGVLDPTAMSEMLQSMGITLPTVAPVAPPPNGAFPITIPPQMQVILEQISGGAPGCSVSLGGAQEEQNPHMQNLSLLEGQIGNAQSLNNGTNAPMNAQAAQQAMQAQGQVYQMLEQLIQSLNQAQMQGVTSIKN
ncbi:MAG: RHS repeat protein [Acidobacteria bacterium]|nr:RHS repeat protein [Acidobacteriota bacterium]